MKIFTSVDDPQVVQLLLGGAVGLVPSDTIYGLVARADDPQAVARLYRIKGREGKRGTIIAASVEQLIELGFDAATLRAVANWWPGPLSVETVCSRAYLHQGLGTVGVRIPNDLALLALLRQTGPLQTTSANPPGEPVANDIPEAEQYFGSRVDFYVDGGDRSNSPPSTLVRVQDGKIEVLRPGAITID